MASKAAFCAAPALPPQHVRVRSVAVPFCAANPPKRIGAVAKDLQQALQASLQARRSRIALQLPPGAKLGTEKREASSSDAILAGDRELARLVTGMFENTGLSVRVIFPGPRERAAAQKMWGPLVECAIVDWGTKEKGKGKKKKKGNVGFGAVVDVKEDDDEADVHIVAGGGAGFFGKARILAERLGQDKLVIVANSNSRREQFPVDLQTYQIDSFEAVYHYEPNPHPKWSGGVLFRKFPDGTVFLL